MQKVLILTHDVIGERMAGPAVRCWEMAKVLSLTNKVILASTSEANIYSSDFEVITLYKNRLQKLLTEIDIIILQGTMLEKLPVLKTSKKFLVIDLYDPFILENLEVHKELPIEARKSVHKYNSKITNEQLLLGDFFLCASEKQRDYWLGMLTALNRINPLTYDDDNKLRKLIDVAPFGIVSTPPLQTKKVLKGVVEGITKNDKVLLWGGGIWDWFDPLTLIKAIYEISLKRNDVKLFFMGIKHPNPLIPKMDMVSKAINLSKELNLYNKYIFFNQWVPYEERQNYLLESDIGVSMHFDHLETRFSFRTRVMDYLWAGLPIISTQGDSMAQLVQDHELGKVVNYKDVKDVANAIIDLLDNKIHEKYKDNILTINRQFYWEKALMPLVNYCQNPYKAKDAGLINYTYKDNSGRNLSYYVSAAKNYYKNEGLISLTKRVIRFCKGL